MEENESIFDFTAFISEQLSYECLNSANKNNPQQVMSKNLCARSSQKLMQE